MRTIKFSRLSKYKIRKIMDCFSLDLTATETSRVLGLNRKTINRYYNEFREIIFAASIEMQRQELGEAEDFSGVKRVHGKRGRNAAGSAPVFGILQRNGKVFVTLIPNCTKEELMPVIQGKVLEESPGCADIWKGYDGVIVNGYDQYRIFHYADEFVRGKAHLDGMESFWSFAKRRMAKFNGTTDDKFVLFLKESECRFNCKDGDFAQFLEQLFFNKGKKRKSGSGISASSCKLA